MTQSYVQQLEEKILALRQQGVVDIKLFPANIQDSYENVAKGVLDLMDAPVVEDADLF